MSSAEALTEIAPPAVRGGAPVAVLPIDELRTGRIGRTRLDRAHVAALAEVPSEWPPILVRRADYAVIDGHHRIAAARDLGLSTIDVTFFDGDADDADVEFVRRNVTHGLPLTLTERRDAARRFLTADPSRSDRSIATWCGLSPKTVGRVRDTIPPAEVPRAVALDSRRIGRDGRARPVDATSLRARIAGEIARRPDAPLRAIAREVGASPETVRSVRRALQQPKKPQPCFAPVVGLQRRAEPPKLVDDPAFASRDDCMRFVRLFDTTTIDRLGLLTHVDVIPLSRIYGVADEARRRAQAWSEFADVLESRLQRRAF